MPHHVVVSTTQEYCHHGVVAANTVHLVTLTVPQNKAENVAIYVTHRNPVLHDPLWLDFTYPDGSPPASTTLAPEVPNSFVVMPGQTLVLNPDHRVWQVAVTSTGRAPYSVMTMW